MLEALGDNPYFSAGFGLVGVGAGLSVAKIGLNHAVALARRQLLVSMEIPSRDKSYHWVLQWITHHTKGRTQHLSVDTLYQQSSSGSITTFFNLIPSPGVHWITYDGRLLQVQRQREKSAADMHSGTPWETVTLTMLGRNVATFQRLLCEARELALKKEEGTTTVYTSWGAEWRRFGYPRRRRPLSSVILDEGVAEDVLADVRDFINSSQWYIERGIPYRRGYLLHGSPGSGKTSFITALAGELQYNICILNLSERGLTDDRLSHLLSIAPLNSIILLEDIDAAFVHRTHAKEGFSSTVTFSGLLNALDGVASTEERIVFMTTNHLSLLDPALIRPGRVDRQVCIDCATPHQQRQMFLRFFPGQHAMADAFMQKFEGSKVSMAQLQGYFLLHKDDAGAVLANTSTVLGWSHAQHAAHSQQL